ncbi:hypothetical protein KC336_g7940 [Hortaea werneckii]|nr:hypothetical protein KC336_g7940 [Hortaea werneckii]
MATVAQADNSPLGTSSGSSNGQTTNTSRNTFDAIEGSGHQHVNEAENQYPTGARFYSILISMAILMILGGLDASIVATAVPALTDHFHTIADVGWYSVAYRLPFCAFQCFWINLPIGVPTIAVIAFLFSDPRENLGKSMTWRAIVSELDIIGTLAFVPSITCLFLALSWAGTKYDFDSPVVLCLYVGFALLLALFMGDQYRKQDAATLPPSIVKQRSIVAGFIFIFCCAASSNTIEYYMPTYFQVVREYSPARSGYMMIPFFVGFMIGMLTHGSCVSMLGYYAPFMLVASALMPLATGLITTWNLSSSLAKLITYSGLAGFSHSIGFMGPNSAVQTVLSNTDEPLGISVMLFAQHFGPTLSLSLTQTIFTNRVIDDGVEVSEGEKELTWKI